MPDNASAGLPSSFYLFECNKRSVGPQRLAFIQFALDAAGVEFTPENGAGEGEIEEATWPIPSPIDSDRPSHCFAGGPCHMVGT